MADNSKKTKKGVTEAQGGKGAQPEVYLTGIPGFDVLLGGGIPIGSSVLVEGGPGSGKTTFCLNVAANLCKKGKKVLYMSFEEPESRLISHMRSFGWPADEYVKKDILRVKRFNALDVARSVEALLSEAKKELLIEVHPVFFPRDFQPDLVLIDSLTSISSAFSGEESRFRIYMEQLFRYLEKENISSMLIREVANPTHTGSAYVEKGEAVSFLSDGIIVIYNVLYPDGKRGSAIEVLKLRGEPIVKKIVRMETTSRGIVVYPDQQIPKGCTLT
ncbi:MAG: AAA family ATPase [Candidatus Micrarchaeota archaeon]|nr:AAA family ATPase [Candidatus Micrarchaeota archaeon]